MSVSIMVKHKKGKIGCNESSMSIVNTRVMAAAKTESAAMAALRRQYPGCDFIIMEIK